MAKLLIVDDEPDIRENLSECFELENFETIKAVNGLNALEILETQSVDAVIIDLFMPEKNGLETIAELRRRWPKLKIIAMSGGGPARLTGSNLENDLLHVAIDYGADMSLQKPFSLLEAVSAIKRLLASPKLSIQ